MFHSILSKILLGIFAFIVLGSGAVYLYLKIGPKKAIKIPISDSVAEAIVKTTYTDIYGCSSNKECAWYTENQGRPPGASEDRIMVYCVNDHVKEKCPNCSLVTEANRTQTLGSPTLCECINKKCLAKEVPDTEEEFVPAQ